MTIIFFARLFYPHVGGVEKHVLEVGKKLIEKGYKVYIITENQESLPEKAEVEGINIYRINAGKEGRLKKFRIWSQLWKYRKLINNAEIIHCHDIFFWYLPFRFLSPFKKVYTTFHGYEANSIPTRKAIFMHKIAEKLSWGNICIGNFYKKWYGTKATLITYGAVDEKLIQQKVGNADAKKDAIFIGRLEKETGILEYLKALKILKENNIKIRLDVFGDGALGDEAKKYALDNRLEVNFMGFIPNVTDYIKEYKYAFASRYLGIMEAMALRKPVFAQYNNKVKKDYLQITPFVEFISISKDEKEISEAVKIFIKNKNLNILGGFSWVKTETWEKMTSLYLKIWDLA